MTHRNKILFAALLALGLAAIAGFEAHLVSAQLSPLREFSARAEETQRTLARLHHQRDGLARDLALAEQQLARVAALSLPAVAPANADQTVAAWHARAKILRTLANENPASVIPEMKLLTDDDWLRVAQTAAFATDEQRRQTFAALRTAAKRHFAAQLATALRQFHAVHPNTQPATPLDLTPFFAPPADPAMLARYAIYHDGSNASGRNAWIIRETVAIDADYDSRHSINARGGHGSRASVAAWTDDLAPRLQRARQAYTTAHPGAQPNSIAQVAPFIDPPLPPATLEKLLKAERERPR